MIMQYITGGMTIVTFAAGGYAVYERAQNKTLTEKIALTRAELRTCGGRLEAVLRDVRSDNEIDNIDLRTFDIPDHWLRGEDSTDP